MGIMVTVSTFRVPFSGIEHPFLFSLLLEPISMKTFVKINSFGALTHDESRVRHDQDVPRRVDRVWVVYVE